MFDGDIALSQIDAPSGARIEARPATDLNSEVRVLVVDDHPLLRAGIAAVLKSIELSRHLPSERHPL